MKSKRTPTHPIDNVRPNNTGLVGLANHRKEGLVMDTKTFIIEGKVLLVGSETIANYQANQVVVGVDLATMSKVKVVNNNGVLSRVVNKTQAYKGIQPYMQDSANLNLTQDETQQAMKDCKELVVYRSSGAKDSEGKTLTREQQIAQGVARAITIIAKLKDKASKDSTNPTDYDWYILKDTSALVEKY